MNIKRGILCYVPGPKVKNSTLFLEHINRFKRETDLIFCSEHPYPGAIQFRGDPEQFRHARYPSGEKNPFGIANAVFFTALKIAWLNEYTHVIVLEPDVRVGVDYWDVAIWEEYFKLGHPAIAAGTLACYNPCNHSPEATRRWEKLVSRNTGRNFPIATYGFVGAGKLGSSFVFPNGALAVYDVRWLARFYDLRNQGSFMTQVTAWDMSIGIKIWEVFGVDSFSVVGHLNCIYSGFGDIISTEESRRALLNSGKVVAIHQVKSEWVP